MDFAEDLEVDPLHLVGVERGCLDDDGVGGVRFVVPGLEDEEVEGDAEEEERDGLGQRQR